MSRRVRIVTPLVQTVVGLAIIAFAAAIPAYFTRVDKDAVAAAGVGTVSPERLARLYLDSSKVSSAYLVAECAAEGDSVLPEIKRLVLEKPSRGISGGDEPFFDTYVTSLSSRVLERKKSSRVEFPPLYDLLSLGENRDKLSNFLKQSQSPIVGKILSLRDLNTTEIPPAFSSAGAPMESAVLSLALLAQSGDFNEKLLRDFSEMMELAPSTSEERAKFEKFALSVLYLERNCDWNLFRSVFSQFSDLSHPYNFARTAADSGGSSRSVMAALLMSGNAPEICEFLDSARDWERASRVEDLSFAYLNGEGGLSFLLGAQKPIYRPSKFMEAFDEAARPVKLFLAGLASKWESELAWLKVIMAAVGGWFLFKALGGFFGFGTARQGAVMSVLQGVGVGILVAAAFLFVVEPSLFEIKFGGEAPKELKFAFVQNINNLGKEIMNIQLDSATMIAVGAFLLLQFVVYLFCLARLSYIKRADLPADLKFKLLENEDNLFDLNLYVGLTGTVFSLIFLAMNIVSASLMAAYSSTLFGILFTALFKIGNLRPYRRRLIIESRSV